MTFTKRLVINALFCLYVVTGMSLGAAAQNEEPVDFSGRHEIGLSIGANTFLGDLGGTHGIGKQFVKDFNAKTIRPLAGLSYGYFFNNWLKAGFNFNYTVVTAADSLIKNKGDAERWRYYRNLSFRSAIFEANINAEVYPLAFFTQGHSLHKFNPFIGAGVGVFHFNPQAQLNGKWIDLKPLRLEGEGFTEYPGRKEYKLNQLYIPLSLGGRYVMNDNFSLAASVLLRKTFTDYIDDVSTTYIDPTLFDKYLTHSQAVLAKQLYSRSITPWKVKPDVYKADPSHNDTYLSVLFTLTYTFGRSVPFYYGGM